ncbi:N-acetylglucosamine-6-phosphate deacetylase [Paenibacillus sediminis]|uniref:N-acetylglucosamine-6-phosphate deacetylase n=1 Tax=Paenibacillus sediminis TaxID=664909 RepID=A0ABS4H361_9BACL|nr:N-acetylglucosamine-6-phosphate deacetylase [Paenibacillus sediminis]MBP1936969.1 N-acetylglucosamine-6-phosphate deacetylase [Paenibacillus sediminis]
MNNSHSFTISNAAVVTLDSVIEHGIVRVEDGNIVFVGTEDELPADKRSLWLDGVIDAGGGWLLPGFIDVHVHGGYGEDFMNANRQAFDTITKFHRDHGTTAMLATTMTQSRDALDRAIRAVYVYRHERMPYAQLEGVHLEGPFVNPKYKGAQNDAYMIDPQIDWLEDWNSRYPGLIKQVSLAPERHGALEAIRWLRAHHINAAAAHTDATYERIEAAVEAGLNQAVHTFNAMSPLHHRNPGTAGAVLSDDRIVAEVIADGIHVHPAVIRILAKTKRDHNLILITDAMSAAGLGDGQYELGGLPVTVTNGVAKLTQGDSLAGSTLTMIDAVKFVVHNLGVTIPEASVLASYNAARQLGIADRTGSIAAGKQADLVWTNSDLDIKEVWVKGISNRKGHS